MKKKTTYNMVLFCILMVLLFLPMLQGRFHFFPLKPLNGVTQTVEQPELTMSSYLSGSYTKQKEAYVSRHFGFREPFIRLYNQYLWDFYKKSYVNDVTIGKQGWLFYTQSVNDYYGTELYHWHASVEEAKKQFDNEVKYLNWVRTILKENGVEFMVFMAPEKGQIYPEYLPEAERDSTTFNACDYFADRFEAIQFPHIEMTRWFKQMKENVPYLLIPQTGGHWNFSSVYAADSLFRFMADLKDINLPKIHIGALHKSDKYAYEAETDLEQLLNLVRPIRKRQALAPEADVLIEASRETVKPKVLFIGNSFLWRIAHYLPLDQIFSQVEFWYYYSTAYYGAHLDQTCSVSELNLLEKLLDFDYVVWFTTGNQMNKGTAGFAQDALIALALDDSLLMAQAQPIADSLRHDSATMNMLDTFTEKQLQSVLLWRACQAIKIDPGLIPELRGDSLSLRNSDIPYAKIIKDIRKDSVWMAALEAQAFLRTATINQMLHAEADRIIQGKSLYRDQQAEVLFAWHCKQEVEDLLPKMLNEPNTMEIIEKQAIEQEKTIEKSLRDNAEWLIRHKYSLDTCELLYNPDVEIPLPPDYELK